MKKILILFICLTLFGTAGIGTAALANDTMVIKVGIYENNPKIFTDNQGNAAGFWPDIIDYIANREGWQIEWVHGTWTECLTRLQNNEIDMMPDVAYSAARDEIYDFSQEAVYVSWSRVYVRIGSNIESILDLEGKTVAVLEGSVNYIGPEGILKLTETFNIHCTFVPVDSYGKVFELLDKNEVDAGVVSKDFAYVNKTDFDVIETDVVFQPVRLYFAFPPTSSLKTYLISIIDSNMIQLKADGNSIYYQSLNTWFGAKPIEKPVIPTWLMWVLIGIGALAVLLGGGALLLRIEVRRRTKQLALDIARRVKTEKALRESEEKLGLILETIPLGLVVTNARGKIIQVNKAMINLSRFSKKEFIGKSYLNFAEKEDRNRMEKNRIEAIVDGGNQGKEYALKRRDGSKFPTKITWAPIKGATGNIIGVLALIEDIAERRKAEEEHNKVIEYRELDRLRTDLLSTVSHELRTPLAGIKGYTTLLMDYYNKLKRTQKWESLVAIDSSTDRLTDLIDHLLDISRMDSGLFKLKLQPINLNELLTAAMNEAKLRSPKFEFKKKMDKRLPRVTGDPQRLRQVIDNLIDNAVKYSKERTEIILRTEIRPEEVLVSISDHGMGITATELTKIFDRFYRIEERLKKDPGGLGLGLSLCKSLVEAHGGKIWVESEVDKGSTFYFTIPLKKIGEKVETQTKLM
jgi:two-component system cell cycle sensor histidine kinase/response regulator CckA